MGRKPCCEKSSGLKRGPWTIEEDHKLINFILNNGIQCWRVVPKLAGLQRCGKSCRLRWINYLRPDLKRGALTEAEEDMIIQLHARLGNRWSKIAAHFPGRTDNEIKNHWNTRIKKKLKSLGVDPLTHQTLVKQHENHCNSSHHSDDNKGSVAATEVENKLDVLLLQDYQVGGGYETKTMSSMYNSSGLASYNSSNHQQQQIGGGSAAANMGLTMMMSGHGHGHDHQRDFSLNKFGVEFGGGEDFVESWIDSPFQWDAFNTSEEDFL